MVSEIALDIRRAAEERASELDTGPSLAGGYASIALFFTYLDQALSGQGFDDVALEMLEKAMEVTAEIRVLPSLYSGFSGVAWAVEHLRGRLFEESDDEDAAAETVPALTELLATHPWRGDYDLINGLVGLGVYALERLPRVGGRECLELVVERLAEAAEWSSVGATWKTSPSLLSELERQKFPDGNYNLGLAHGVPGVVGLLALAQAHGVECRELLYGAASWLLSRKRPSTCETLFGYTEPAGGNASEASRLAWCYGDLGIAASLMVAASALGEGRWYDQALEIASKATDRTLENSGVADAGLCHGSGGVSHLFNRLYQATDDPRFLAAARVWIDHTLRRFRSGEGFGGYQARLPDESSELTWQNHAGFLMGSTGIGLAMLAAASDQEPEWDRVLLVSGRPVEAPVGAREATGPAPPM